MESLASENIAITVPIPMPALTSIGIAFLTVVLKLVLIWASRATHKTKKGKRLEKDDFLIWSDLVVIGALALFFLAVTRVENHNISVATVVILALIILIVTGILPNIINDFSYNTDNGDLKGKGVVWLANAFGLVILIFCVALGAVVHG
jgi:hypothetical protein